MVGDDDQSIYRFRGASVANLLQFPLRFPGCRVLELSTNYRSHPGIVAASREWMATAAGWEVDGRCFRYAKALVAHTPETHPDHPAVISVQGTGARDEVRQLGELLRFLRDNGVIASYGQAALLLHSVKEQVSGPYLDGLECAGIPARCEPAGRVRAPADDKLLVTTIHQAKGAGSGTWWWLDRCAAPTWRRTASAGQPRGTAAFTPASPTVSIADL